MNAKFKLPMTWAASKIWKTSLVFLALFQLDFSHLYFLKVMRSHHSTFNRSNTIRIQKSIITPQTLTAAHSTPSNQGFRVTANMYSLVIEIGPAHGIRKSWYLSSDWLPRCGL